MKLKKVLTLLIVLSLMTTAFIGCGGKETNDNQTSTSKGESTSKTEKAKDPVEISFSIWDNNQLPGMEAVAEAFMAENPDVKVKVEVTPWGEYWTKLEASAVGGAMPDVFWMHTNEFFKYATNKKLMPIDNGMIDTSKFPQGLVDLFTYDGELYGVPKDFDTIAIFYNKEIFDTAGMPYPDDTWDWDKFVEVAKALTDEEAGIYGFGAEYTDQEGFYNFIYQNGGTVLTDEHTSGYALPETREAVQFYFDLINKYGVSPSIEYFSENGVTNTFASGKLAMVMRGSWNMSSYSDNELIKDKFDLAVLPKGKTRASIYNGLTYSGANSTEHPEEVKRFLAFCGTKEANIIQGEYKAAIPAYEDTQSSWVSQLPEYNVQAFVDMLDYAIPFPTSQNKPKWAEYQSSTLKAFATGELAADEAFDYLTEEMDKVLAKEK